MVARAGVETTTLRLKVIDSTNAPPCPTSITPYSHLQLYGGLSIRALAILKVSETLFTLIHRPHRLSAMIPKTNHVSEPKSFAALLLYLIESPTIGHPEKC